MLADHAHEALVVLLLALRQRIALVPRRFTRRESVELVQLHTTCSEFGIVDILRWPHDQVAQGLHHDGHQVRAYPVEGHAGGHVHAQDEGQHDGQPVGGVLLHLRLLALQRLILFCAKPITTADKPARSGMIQESPPSSIGTMPKNSVPGAPWSVMP